MHLLRSLPAPTHEYYRVVLPRHAKISFRRIYREVQPDVVHAQCHYMIGEAAINEAERRRIRIVSTNHFMPENLEPFLPFPQWFLDIVSRVSWKDMGRLMGKGAVVTTPTALAAQAMAEHAETVELRVTQGSAEVVSVVSGGFARRAAQDGRALGLAHAAPDAVRLGDAQGVEARRGGRHDALNGT